MEKRPLFIFIALFTFTMAWATDYYVAELNNSVLTFKKTTMAPDGVTCWDAINSGSYLPTWHSIYESVEHVVFDSSFAEARPQSCAGWFDGCTNLTSIEGLEYLNTSNVTTMQLMFFECSKLTSLDVSHFNTSNVTNMINMFSECRELTSLDISHFNTGKVTDMSYMFMGCSGLSSIDVSNWDMSNVTSIAGLFSWCSQLTSIDLSHNDLSKVTDMSQLFCGCSGLTSIDLSYFDTSKITNMNGMFAECTGLTSLDVSHFDTSNVTDMGNMFSGCTSLTSLDVSNFNTSKVTCMLGLFERCSKIGILSLTNFDTSNVTEVGPMFWKCSALTSVDLSSFDTRNVWRMEQMFEGCNNLQTIYVSDYWNTDNVTESMYMFKDCTSIRGGEGTVYSSSYIDKTYARIDGGTNTPGYLTRKQESRYIYGTDTELTATGGADKDTQVNGKCYHIEGTYIAGKGSIQAGDMTSKGFKLRTGQNGGKAVITVNSPYVINSLKITAIANYLSKSNGTCIKVSKVEVDGKEVTFSGGEFPEKSSTTSATLLVEDIQAEESIAISFDNSNAEGTQINACFEIGWTCPDLSTPYIQVSTQAVALIPSTSYPLMAQVAPPTFDTYWYSDNTAVATVDENGIVTAMSPGMANIYHAWTSNRTVSDKTLVTVTDMDVWYPYVVKELDFSSMGDVTLEIGEEPAGQIYNAANRVNTNVYPCTNAGLESLAFQSVINEEKGWTILDGTGLYMGKQAGRCAAICNLKAGQIVEIVYTGSTIYMSDGDDSASKVTICEGTGRAIYKVGEDGMVGFELVRGCAVQRIVIYDKKTLLLSDIEYERLPEDILYDGQPHELSARVASGMGTLHVYYTDEEGTTTETAPSAPGTYTVSLAVEEGEFNHVASFEEVFTFTIYAVDAVDYQTLKAVYTESFGNGEGWKHTWDFSGGTATAGSLYGVTFSRGQVTGIDLSDNNMSGSFPLALLAMTHLELLDVSNNDLSGDIGLMMAAYQQATPTQIGLESLDITGNKLSGNIGLFAKFCPNLKTLYASENQLEDVYPIISLGVAELNISKQQINRVVELHLANLSIEDFATKVPSILLYDHWNQTFSTDINLFCSTQDNSWEMIMASQNGQLSVPYVSEQNTYYGENGDKLNVAVIDNYGTREGSTFRIALSFDEGDANFDGQVNVLDLQTDINYIMEQYNTRPFNFTAANLWKDEQINVQDVIRQVNLLLSIEESDEEATADAKRRAPVTYNAAVYVENGELMLNTTYPVAAFDITISGALAVNVAKNLEQLGMSFTKKVMHGGVRIIGYSLSGACIPTGITSIGSLNAKQATVRSAMLADGEANAISVSVNGSTTGINNVEAKSDGHSQMFDLSGRPVVNSKPHGFYIKNGKKMIK